MSASVGEMPLDANSLGADPITGTGPIDADGGDITSDGSGNLTANSFVGPLTGNVTGNIHGTVTATGGFTGTIALAKLTPVTGANGSITVVAGIITGFVAPT